ncbi:BglG family transcription antiterminator [Microbacterium sp.]|uniref:BglG family transcription antiterminator n=1 Tax=Microbacterium sp. TaxID=51671 RepID=UPI0039E4779B
MSRARHDQVIAHLLRGRDWVTAAELAAAIGVTPRSIRSYVTAINGRVPGGDAVESGPRGYRAGAHAADALRASDDAPSTRDRLHRLVRALVDAPDGVDVFDTAAAFFVSPATVDADLARVRALLGGTELTLHRTASRALLRGPETAQRRLLSRLAHDEMEASAFDLDALQRALGAGAVETGAYGRFKTRLVAGLQELGHVVNEFSIGDVMMHVAIAADRVARQHRLDDAPGSDSPERARIGELIDRLAQEHLAIRFGRGDLSQLAGLVQTRIVAAAGAARAELIRERLPGDVESAVRDVVARAEQEFLIDLDDEDFVLRLAQHVENLRERAQEGAWSRNPLTRSLKTAYPMIFEVAVFIADGLRGLLGLPILDDEIAYLAMHVGGHLERHRQEGKRLTVTIVCPGYYDIHELLHARVDQSFGAAVDVVGVDSRADPDWASIDTDLVLTTIEPRISGDGVVQIQPFLTESDVTRVQTAIARVRRVERLARLRAELERYFDADAFVPRLDGDDGEEGVIRRLGALLVSQGVIDQDYVERAIEREHLSSTAFSDALAVPHSLTMTATRTAIAVGIADPPIAWGEGHVQVVAMVAFSESDRTAFQTVFEQLVEVFSEHDAVQRIVRRATTFSDFLDELVAVVED